MRCLSRFSNRRLNALGSLWFVEALEAAVLRILQDPDAGREEDSEEDPAKHSGARRSGSGPENDRRA